MSARSSSIQAQLAAIVLTFEIVVIFLGALTLFGLDELGGFGLPRWSGLVFGGVLLVLAVLALGLLRSGRGYGLGWAVQALLLASGVLNGALVIVGGIFGGIWWYALHQGRKIDQRNRGWAADDDAASES